jgi:hypothetical protein
VNSRERVQAALRLEVPDRVPFGEFAVDFDTAGRIIGHETYVRAKAKCQVAFWEGRRDEVVQSWKEDGVALYRKLPMLDIVNVDASAFGQVPPRGYEPRPPRKIADDTWEDREGRVYRYSPVTGDITMVHDPLNWDRPLPEPAPGTGAGAPADVKPPDPSVFEVIDHLIAELGKDRFIIGPSGTAVELVQAGDMERTMVEVAQNPEGIERLAASLALRGDAEDAYCIRPGQHGVLWGQDYASNAGPFLSPQAFRRLALPALSHRVASIKRTHRMPVLKHACGNNWALLDMFVEAGFAAYQSIQQSAGMDLPRLKSQYGRRICLWGGIPVEHLVGGTPAEIREDVRAAVAAGAPGGGYIFGSSHSIAVGTRYDNFMAMVDEFERVRGKPLN